MQVWYPTHKYRGSDIVLEAYHRFFDKLLQVPFGASLLRLIEPGAIAIIQAMVERIQPYL